MAVELSFSPWAEEMILTLVGGSERLPEALGWTMCSALMTAMPSSTALSSERPCNVGIVAIP